MPALTNWGAERVGKTILALANAYVEAFTLHGVPSDVWAERINRVARRELLTFFAPRKSD